MGQSDDKAAPQKEPHPVKTLEEIDREISAEDPDAGRFFRRDKRIARKLNTLGMSLPKPITPNEVVLPKHYARFQIEPVHFIGANNLNFFQGNIVKYILRYDAKNGLEDVRKAIRYARMFELFLMGYPEWYGPDPRDAEINARLESIFDGVRAIAHDTLADDPDRRAAVLKGITLLESKHHGQVSN